MEIHSLKYWILASLGQFPFFVLGFFITLKMLGVTDKVLKRSSFLSLLFVGLLVIIGGVLSLLIPILIGWTPLLAAIAFILLIPRYLTLKNWQAIVIPFGIYMFGNLGLVVILMGIFNLFATK